MTDNKKNMSYFAAANGYSGFRSSFDKVFSPYELTKLFVIKGGPGTGKSTMMKKIANAFADCANVTSIYCSSDPNSLDGLIIEKNNVKVGVADGTAPHVIEPKHPGAFEEIINLGDAFDYHQLSDVSNRIFELGDYKKHYYKKAYSALAIAGKVHSYILDYLLDNNVYNKAEMMMRDFFNASNIKKTTLKNSDFLVGAFCKDGYVRLKNPTDKITVSISGDGILEYVLMSKLKDILLLNDGISQLYSSAYLSCLVDAIETEDTIFVNSNENICNVDASELVGISSEYEHIKSAYDNLLNEAKNAFTQASYYHFKLEEIYSKNICFEKNNDKYSRIISEINCLFSK